MAVADLKGRIEEEVEHCEERDCADDYRDHGCLWGAGGDGVRLVPVGHYGGHMSVRCHGV